jgi:hypothetical protein
MANVNGVQLVGAAASSPPELTAVGTDTNIDLELVPKGTGTVALAAPLGGSAGATEPFGLAAATITPGSDADVTLTAAQYVCPVLTLADGSWTGAHNIIVPTHKALYVVINGGSYTATVKTAAGTGVGVATTKTQILWCDGTNVVALTAAV